MVVEMRVYCPPLGLSVLYHCSFYSAGLQVEKDYGEGVVITNSVLDLGSYSRAASLTSPLAYYGLRVTLAKLERVPAHSMESDHARSKS